MLVSSKGMSGLLYSVSDNSPGENNACGMSYISYLADPFCWGSSFSDWANAYNGQSLATTVLGSNQGNILGNGDSCSQVIGMSCPMMLAGGVVLLLLLRR